MWILNHTNEDYNSYLVGVQSNVTVARIAQIVMEEVGIQIPIKYIGDYKGSKGDVHKYSYDVSRLRLMGWAPKYTAEEAVRKSIRENMNNISSILWQR